MKLTLKISSSDESWSSNINSRWIHLRQYNLNGKPQTLTIIVTKDIDHS